MGTPYHVLHPDVSGKCTGSLGGIVSTADFICTPGAIDVSGKIDIEGLALF